MGNITVEDEVWRDIEGWSYHQVSDHGRVRVFPGAKIKNRIVREIEFKKPTLDCYGYLKLVQGGVGRGRVHKVHKIHSLVLTTFIGPPSPGQVCRHLNGVSIDNRLENLVWGTPTENQRDRMEHGTDTRGEDHALAKLTESDVIEIRRSNAMQKELAKKYGVTRKTISLVRSRRTWNHVPSDSIGA
jgi:hypothetical protein